MKTVYNISLSTLILSFLFFCFSIQFNFSDKSYKKPTKAYRIDEAIAMEIEITKDLDLNYVPKDRIHIANQVAEQYRKSIKNRRPKNTIDWLERGPINVGGRTRAIIFDEADSSGTTILAGSASGGVWRGSQIFTAKPFWINLTPDQANLAIGSLAQDPANPLIIYAGTGEGWFNGDAVRGIGILKSVDGGISWDRIQNTNNSHFKYVQKIAIDRFGHVYACTRGNGVMKSQDQGEHWTKVLGSGFGAFSDRAADIEIAADGTLFASLGIFSSDGIYRSDNDGNSWQFIHQNGMPDQNFRRAEIALAPSNENVVYAILEDNDGACLGIYRSQNKGDSWTSLPVPTSASGLLFGRNQLWYDLTLAVNPFDENRLIIGGVNLYQSLDGGASWIQLSNWFDTAEHPFVHADQHSILYHKTNPERVLFANDGGVFACNNLNTTNPQFIHVVTDYNVTQFYSCAIHPTKPGIIAGGSQDNGCLAFADDFSTNAMTITDGDGGFTHYAGADGEYLITSFTNNNYNIYLDNDLISELSFDGGSFINPTAVNDHFFYGNADEGRYFRIDLQGNLTEEIIQINALGESTIRHLSPSPNIANRIYFGNSSGQVVYADNVDEGMIKNGIEIMNKSGSVSCIAIEKGNEDHVIVTISNYGETSVWESRNGGGSWEDIETNIPDMPVRWVIFGPGLSREVLLATETGIWRTDSLQGSSTAWYPDPLFPNARTDMIKIHEATGRIAVATHGRGIFTTDYYSQFVATSYPKYDQMKIKLYPNPTSDYLFIQSTPRVSGRYAIYLLDGRLMTSGSLNTDERIDIRRLPAGSFILTMENKGMISSEQFVKL